MQVAANVLACSAIDLIQHPEIIKKAQKELLEILCNRKYKPLLPEDTCPPININEKTMEKYRPLMAAFYKSDPPER